jgi:hypothetical protein
MKKVSVVLLLCAMAMTLSFTSCGGGGGSNPVDIETTLWKYIQKGDYEKAIKYTVDISVTGENTEMMKTMGAMFAGKMKEAMEEKGGLKDFKVTEVSNDGTTAVLNVNCTYGDGTTDDQSTTYTKIDGKWKKTE